MSPLVVLLTTADGVISSSVGDFVRGGTMPTTGRQSSQWEALWEARPEHLLLEERGLVALPTEA